MSAGYVRLMQGYIIPTGRIRRSLDAAQEPNAHSSSKQEMLHLNTCECRAANLYFSEGNRLQRLHNTAAFWKFLSATRLSTSVDSVGSVQTAGLENILSRSPTL